MQIQTQNPNGEWDTVWRGEAQDPSAFSAGQARPARERASQALALTQSKQRAGYRLSRAPDFQQALAELGAKLGERLVAPPELAGEMLDANLAYLAVPAGSRRR